MRGIALLWKCLGQHRTGTERADHHLDRGPTARREWVPTAALPGLARHARRARDRLRRCHPTPASPLLASAVLAGQEPQSVCRRRCGRTLRRYGRFGLDGYEGAAVEDRRIGGEFL